ncbi:related to E3 ubiquitin ligase [Phialocephala subalpina]|uniref:Related to E3 ubiquitin ligase n=1 Tax=Phialocephala subalpina TaxID=576137 RepID=A0A1L7WEN5_9HELO|nr:related to E3 ubiquitin ligase [Phialocephala subalpina]
MASEASGVATVTESTDSPATARGGRGGGRGRGRGGRGRGRGDSFQGDNGGYDNRQAHHRGRGRGQSNPAQVARPSNIGGNGAGGETPDGKGKENMAGKTIAEGANETEAESEGTFVIFTDDAEKRYEEFTDADIASVDQNIGIRYENNDIQDDTRLLLRYNCPDQDCDVACLSWPLLHKHVQSVHQKKICDLCSRHKKVFTHEHVLYKDAELSKHMKKGDDNPGAVDQSGFKGHPLCSFCGLRFYGDDELFVHCREKHERCQLCDNLGGRPPQYFLNYDALYAHFKADHFVCSHPSCLEKKFIAFTSEIDLKAHQLSEHGNDLSKDVRRDARVVDMANFEYRQPYVQERRGGGSQREQRDGRGRGRGRDPNTEPIPASSAQPLRRDQQAFQRQMEIQTAAGSRTFGGQLTAAPTPAQASARPAPRPSTQAVAAATQAVNNLDLAEVSPQEQARQLRHRDVIDRASTLLQNDSTKLQQFRNSISSFKNNALSAAALIEAFFALFSDTSASALGTLVREVADLYEDKTKADSLRTAWNNWRAINEDYPSLPAASGSGGSTIPLNWAVSSSAAAGGSSGNGGGAKSTRVLKLKSSTAQSSRSSVSQARSWGGSSTASSPSTSSAVNSFPSLPPTTRPNASSTKVSTTPWVPPPAATSSSNPSSARPTPPTSRPASRNVAKGGDAFPALPPAAKPQSTIMGYGNGRMVRRDLVNSPVTNANPWGPPSASNGGPSIDAAEAEDANGKGKKKGNKNKKQVLMNWG